MYLNDFPSMILFTLVTLLLYLSLNFDLIKTLSSQNINTCGCSYMSTEQKNFVFQPFNNYLIFSLSNQPMLSTVIVMKRTIQPLGIPIDSTMAVWGLLPHKAWSLMKQKKTYMISLWYNSGMNFLAGSLVRVYIYIYIYIYTQCNGKIVFLNTRLIILSGNIVNNGQCLS